MDAVQRAISDKLSQLGDKFVIDPKKGYCADIKNLEGDFYLGEHFIGRFPIDPTQIVPASKEA